MDIILPTKIIRVRSATGGTREENEEELLNWHRMISEHAEWASNGLAIKEHAREIEERDHTIRSHEYHISTQSRYYGMQMMKRTINR